MPYIVTTDSSQEGKHFAEDFQYENSLKEYTIVVANEPSDLANVLAERDGSVIILDEKNVIGENLFEFSFLNIGRVIYLTTKSGTDHSDLTERIGQVFIHKLDTFELKDVNFRFKKIFRGSEYTRIIDRETWI